MVDVSYRFVVAEDTRLTDDYLVFVHVYDEKGESLWNDDHEPAVPTREWKPGAVIEYSRPLLVPRRTLTGTVSIELGLGIVFQMPVLIFFFTLLRIVSPRFLLEHVRYAILGIFILAAVITPTPDVFNMLLFAGPMILLFFVGIGASYILVYHREGKQLPWFRIILVSILILGTIIGGTIYYLQLQHGFRFVPEFPWFVR